MGLVVMKFGGTSVGSAEALQTAARIVKNSLIRHPELIVVVSAMRGVTDGLLKSAEISLKEGVSGYRPIIDELRRTHLAVWEELFPSRVIFTGLMETFNRMLIDLENICYSISIMGEVTPRGLDMISSFGERINARAFAALLEQMGVTSHAVDASDIIVSDGNFQNALPLMETTRVRCQDVLRPMIAKKMVPVVTGFIAATENGVMTTLGRGGSDFTAAILGDALDAAEVWIWTDVDGVMSADPRIAVNARVIPQISFAEVGEMAYFGAKVLHPKTIRPVVQRNIPLWVKNTFHPENPGTQVLQHVDREKGKVTAVSAIRSLSLITVAGRGMLGVPGIAARTFSAVARKDASVLMISQSSSEQSICFVIPDQDARAVLVSLTQEFASELNRRDIDDISARSQMVIVTVTGMGMNETPGVAASIFGALGKASINVVAIAQGSSEYSISLLLEASHADEAIRVIHAEAIEKNGE